MKLVDQNHYPFSASFTKSGCCLSSFIIRRAYLLFKKHNKITKKLSINFTIVVKSTYKDCFPGSLDKSDWRLSSLVLSMVTFLRTADRCRCASGPVADNELLPDIMFVISSASLIASLYSLTHGSAAAAISLTRKIGYFLLTIRRKIQYEVHLKFR